jgi:tRNA(adenine34) deaminase
MTQATDTIQPTDADHTRYMQAALREAKKAADCGDVPVGAVVVREGRIIGRGHNLREQRQDAVLHAEIVAIRQARRKLRSWRLDNCTLYVTLEPCLMCSGAILQSRISQLIFGATDAKAGACCSVVRSFDLPLHHTVNWQQGVMADECSRILRDFFKNKRISKKQLGTRGQRKTAALDKYQQRIQLASNTEPQKRD